MGFRTLEPGLRVGKYELIKHIASGGMGAVYKAVDRELRRTVALKVLPTQRAETGSHLERFRREALHAARLNHPNIVTLFDHGHDETQNVYYLAMEFIDGIDLAQHITRKGRLSPRETRHILVQTSEALDHAFLKDVIHRDIKPSNFLLARVRDKVLVKLTDFGLALGSSDDFKVTREGSTVGTIDYMAPEQARDSRAADIRSDIYSLGCTAYHMLTGNPPFAEGGIGERVRKHLHEAPTDVREFNPEISAGLWGIVRTMLAKNPADRYANPGELLADLKRVQSMASADEANLPTLQPIAGNFTAAAPSPTTTKVAPNPVTQGTVELSAQTTTESEPPKTSKKKSKSKPKKRSAFPWLVGGGIGAGICVLVAGAVLFEGWRRSSPGPNHPGVQVVKGNRNETPNPGDPLPLPKPAPPVVLPVGDPKKTNPGPGASLEPLAGFDWPGRQLVPFDAVAPRARLDEIKAVHLKGTIALASSPRPLNMVMTWEAMNRLKCQESTPFTGAGSTLLLVGNHGWVTTGSVNRIVAGEMLSYFQTVNYATMLADLIVLNQGGFEIEKSDSTQVRGKDCFSLQVKRLNRPPLKMYFAKESNLLHKVEFQARMLDKNLLLQPGPTQVEIYFGNYQVFDGINHWRRQEQWRDGQKFSELNLLEVRLLRKADDAYFAGDGLDEAAKRALTDYRKDIIQRAVFQMVPQGGSDFSRLARGLTSKDAALRCTARDALVAYAALWRNGQAVALQGADVQGLTTLLRCMDDDLPAFAIDAIARLGPPAADAASPLVALAQTSTDPKLLVRMLAALKNIAVRSDQTASLCLGLLDHRDAGVKDAAALALFQLGPERLDATRLADLMAWPNALTRTEAEKLLRQRLAVVAPSDLPALRQGLKHPVREVRLAYIDAVATLQNEGRDAAPDLCPLLISTDNQTAAQATRTLAKMGMLLEYARDHADPAVVAAALTALRTQGLKSTEALTIYEKQLNHGSEKVTNAAALAILEFAPERLSKARLLEYMARPRPVDLAATLALSKADPGNPMLKSKGIPILIDGLTPDVSDLRAFLTQPFRCKPAAAILDIGGAPVIEPVVKNLLIKNYPKYIAENQNTEPTAARFLGYEMLKEFAKRAKAKQDRDLIAALKKQETNLHTLWVPQEAHLVSLPNQTPESRQLRSATAEAAGQALALIKSLR